MTNIELRRIKHEQRERWQIHQASLLDTLGLFVPLAAPLVPAYLTATAIYKHYPALLGLDEWAVLIMAIIAGAVIEVLGILSIETMFEMRSYNNRFDTNEAPFSYAVSAVAFYLALVVGLVLLLKIWPEFALWSLAPLTILGFVTSWVMVLRRQHSDRVFDKEISLSQIASDNDKVRQLSEELSQLVNDKKLLSEQLSQVVSDKKFLTEQLSQAVSDKKRLTEELSQAVKLTNDNHGIVTVTPTIEDVVTKANRGDKVHRQNQVLDRLRLVSLSTEIDYADIADKLGSSDRTIRRDIEELVKTGRLSMNGVVKVVA